MKSRVLASLFCLSALCILPASAAPATPAKPATPLEEAKAVSKDIKNAMDSMVSAIEKAKDEKTAQDAADAIFATTEKVQELARSSKTLKDKLTEEDKKKLEENMEQLNMGQFQQRLSKAFMGLAEKPELLEILKPALTAFSMAAMTMAAEEAGQGAPIRARDKGMPPRGREQGDAPRDNSKSLVE